MMGKNICKICGEKEKIKINKNDFFLRIDSSNKKLIEYKNFVCVNCGNIYHYPDINTKKLIKHYQTKYRNTDSVINLDVYSTGYESKLNELEVLVEKYEEQLEQNNQKPLFYLMPQP